jgi:hypothetical protein
MAKMVSVRLDDGLIGFLDEYAKARGASRTDIVAAALRSFLEDTRTGVPEIKVASVPGPVAVEAGPGWSLDERQARLNRDKYGKDWK